MTIVMYFSVVLLTFFCVCLVLLLIFVFFGNFGFVQLIGDAHLKQTGLKSDRLGQVSPACFHLSHLVFLATLAHKDCTKTCQGTDRQHAVKHGVVCVAEVWHCGWFFCHQD